MLHFLWRRRFGLLIATLGLVLFVLVLMALLPLLGQRGVPIVLRPFAAAVESPLLAAYLSFLELSLVLAGVALAAYHFRHQRAASFIERFNAPDVLEVRNNIDRWLDEYEASPLRTSEDLTPDDSFRLAHLEARLLLELERAPELDKAVKSFANLFQELGEAYENRTASPSYTRRMFDHLAPHYWRLLRFWVEDYRLRKSPTLYRRFENLAQKLAVGKKKEQKQHDEVTASIPPTSTIRRELLQRAVGSRRVFIFGYGSLVYSRSRKHIGPDATILQANLQGYARAWNVTETVLADDAEITAVFLDLVLSESGNCNGVLIEIDEAQLAGVDRREKSYVRVDVTAWIDCPALPPGAVVFTYVGRTECTVGAAGTTKLYSLADYMRLLDDGLEEYSPEFKRAFWSHTLPAPANLVMHEGPYRFLDPVQNRATGRDREDCP